MNCTHCNKIIEENKGLSIQNDDLKGTFIYTPNNMHYIEYNNMFCDLECFIQYLRNNLTLT
ncbi:MAG: hypothetical protein M0R17_02590 [Candidatus Omnitrophica bacterium]|jgi:hypothetical protein|nr:hypothetical protein [Candidatus Omnitrophota bacterium]